MNIVFSSALYFKSISWIHNKFIGYLKGLVHQSILCIPNDLVGL